MIVIVTQIVVNRTRFLQWSRMTVVTLSRDCSVTKLAIWVVSAVIAFSIGRCAVVLTIVKVREIEVSGHHNLLDNDGSHFIGDNNNTEVGYLVYLYICGFYQYSNYILNDKMYTNNINQTHTNSIDLDTQ